MTERPRPERGAAANYPVLGKGEAGTAVAAPAPSPTRRQPNRHLPRPPSRARPPPLRTWSAALPFRPPRPRRPALRYRGPPLRTVARSLRRPPSRRVRPPAPASAVQREAIRFIESYPTRIFLPNERAAEPQIAAIYERFGLNARQIEILSRATPKRDYYCQSRRGNRLFELGLAGRGGAGLRRRLGQVRPAPHHRDHRSPRASRLRRRMAAAPQLRLGHRASSHRSPTPTPAGATIMTGFPAPCHCGRRPLQCGCRAGRAAQPHSR